MSSIIGLYVLLPLLIGYFYEPAELPKTIFVFILLSLALFKQGKLDLNKVDKTFLIFILFAFLSSLQNQELSQAIFGQPYRYQGLLLLLALWLVTKNTPTNNKAATLSSIVISLLLILDFSPHQIDPSKSSATFGNHHFAASWVALTSAFFTTPYLYPITFLSLLLSKSIPGLLAFGFLVFTKISKNTKLNLLIFFALSLASIFFATQEKQSSFDQRSKIWTYAQKAFVEKPLQGWGWQNFYTGFSYVLPEPEQHLKNIRVDHAHNLWANLLVETGLAGTAIFLYLCLQIYKTSRYPNLLLVFLLLANLNPISVTTWVWFFVSLANQKTSHPSQT